MIRLFLFLILLSSCDSYSVKQIPVKIPAGLIVPDEMVYIPAGEFIMGHAEEAGTEGGRQIMSNAYLIDRYEVSHESYQKLRPKHSYHPKKARWPVSLVTYAEADSFAKIWGSAYPMKLNGKKRREAQMDASGPGKFLWIIPITDFQVLCRNP